MEKRADAADASVLFFSLAVLFFFGCIRANWLKTLCYYHCAKTFSKSNVLKALCYMGSAV